MDHPGADSSLSLVAPAAVEWICANTSAFFNLSSGTAAALASGEQASYVVGGSVSYPVLLAILAFLMGLGKGGVPGSSTCSVALNSLLAPSGLGCLDAAVALGVPITFLADLLVSSSYFEHARWDVIMRLLPATGLGVAVGTQVMGKLSEAQAKLLIGSILMFILLVNLSQELLVKPAQEGKAVAEESNKTGKALPPEERVPSYATSIWFVSLMGGVGGFATILTNSMGPMLNVFLLTLKLDPQVFVGTRATFFTIVNTIKLAQRLSTGTLSLDLVKVGILYGFVALFGVLVSKQIIKRMSKTVFVRLEYGLMTFASLKLIDVGTELNFFSFR
ncbi:unnamed protein product [Polarella glacialis]|uniref:Membrane transporter protein n=1 Tax=Polarella glacialis TaxID=89957 RepID=A0A813LK15_POLGL|nr:unnamed protein product [Polarella glacialis]